jgi:hypothetical protein
LAHILPSNRPDPWMLNATREWCELHPVGHPDPRPLLYHNRVIRLANALFTVSRRGMGGLETLRQRFLRRNDTRAAFFEAEIASLLVYNGCKVDVVEESGTRGDDFDLLAKVKGIDVSVEVTSVGEKIPLSIGAFYNRLKSKRNQVPADRPAVLYVNIPGNWMRRSTFSEIVLHAALRRFLFRSRRYNMIVLMWDTPSFNSEGDATVHRRVQPIYNNIARHRIPDVSVFGLKRDMWGTQRMADSFYRYVKRYRDNRMSPKERG